MKQYKYFGDFNSLNFYNLNDNDKFNVFISKSYFKQSLRLKQTGFKQDKKELGVYINYIEILNTVHEFFLDKEVAEEIYGFLIDKYSAGIGADNVFFIQKFTDQTFGLDHFESKKYAIDHFKTIFKSLYPLGLLPKGYSKKTGEVEFHTHFYTLHRAKFDLIDMIRRDSQLFIPYLVGDLDFFDVHLYNTNATIKKIMNFENELLKLKALNNEFNFEVDEYFAERKKSTLIHQNYKAEFESLEQLIFIENQIENQENIDRAFIVSLFYFFKTEINLKMPSAKLFTKIVNDFFNLNIGLIKDPSSETKAHINRTEKLKNEWENFISRMSKT